MTAIKVCGIALKSRRVRQTGVLQEYYCDCGPVIRMRKHRLGFGKSHWWDLEFEGAGLRVSATPNIEKAQDAAAYLERAVKEKVGSMKPFLLWMLAQDD